MVNKIFLVIVLFLINSCSSTTVPTQTKTQSISDFPTSVGNSWTYATYDSVAHIAGTLKITILNNVSATDTQLTQMWQLKSDSNVDTEIVSIKNDTVLFLNKTFYPVTNMTSKLIFPLRVGNGWLITGVARADTVFVVEKSVHTVRAGSFPNTFRIEEIMRGPNWSGHNTSWFTPKVGIIWLHHKAGNMVSVSANVVWQLDNYHIINYKK